MSKGFRVRINPNAEVKAEGGAMITAPPIAVRAG
jgi:hypothetical protein